MGDHARRFDRHGRSPPEGTPLIRRATRDWDESDVRIRPGRGSRPRTKKRPDHADARPGFVVGVDRGRWACVLGSPSDADAGTRVVCMRARELGHTSIVVGDRVDIVGDVSGRPDTLARIVRRADRTSVLRRTADDTDPFERIVVANAERLLIVVALADPPPRTGFVERALVAAFAGGLRPVICLTKSDLESPEGFAAEFADLDVEVVVCGIDDPVDPLLDVLGGRLSALIGHSGVGKSTLVNRLVPAADRATGNVSGIGRGRHTSTSSAALPLPAGGWVIDTPGIRSFGLAHVRPGGVLAAFGDLARVTEDCPRGCSHLGPPADPDCALDELLRVSSDAPVARRARALRALLAAVRGNEDWALDIDRDGDG